MPDADNMGRFWDARAREDANFFVDNRLVYKAGDEDRFWADGEKDVDTMLGIVGAPALTGTEVVLDIGCGVGRLSRVMAGRAATVHGIDVSEEMLKRARRNLAEVDNVVFHHGDGTTLAPIADASIDVAISLVVFQHIPDPAITLGYLREIGRVLRPGGWTTFQISDDPEIHSRDYPTPSLLKRAIGRAPRGQNDPEWRGSAVPLGDVEEALSTSGLTVENIAGAGSQYCIVYARRG